MKSKLSIPKLPEVGCDLCGSTRSRFILTTPRLDGPLVQCEDCGLFYVIFPDFNSSLTTGPPISESVRTAEEMKRLSERARELFLIDPQVENNEKKWREITAVERLSELQKITSLKGGQLLEIGSSTGEFLRAASSIFQAIGVEADPSNCQQARSNQVECFNGTLFDAGFPAEQFDAVALYHVIEHVPSPQRLLQEIHRILKPQGWLILETPNIDTVWYRLLGAKWRQFIPDHRYFFTPATIRKSIQAGGFDIFSLNVVGKAMSWRLFVNRLGRYHQALAGLLARFGDKLELNERTLRLNLGDVMRVYGKRR